MRPAMPFVVAFMLAATLSVHSASADVITLVCPGRVGFVDSTGTIKDVADVSEVQIDTSLRIALVDRVVLEDVSIGLREVSARSSSGGFVYELRIDPPSGAFSLFERRAHGGYTLAKAGRCAPVREH